MKYLYPLILSALFLPSSHAAILNAKTAGIVKSFNTKKVKVSIGKNSRWFSRKAIIGHKKLKVGDPVMVSIDLSKAKNKR